MPLHRRILLLLAWFGVACDAGVARADSSHPAPRRIALPGPSQIVATDDHGPPPTGYTTMHRRRKGPIIAGSLMLGVAYVECALVAAAFELGGGKHEGALWIPLIGPFAQLGQSHDSTENVLLLGVGGAQVAGAILLSYGLTTRRRVFVRDDLVPSVSVAPIVGKGVSGLALSGRF